MSFYTDRLKWLSLYGSVSSGSGVNYSPAWFLEPYVGSSTDASFGFSMRPNSRLRIDNFYYYDDFYYSFLLLRLLQLLLLRLP